jgi:hypothetical protein
MMYGREDVSHRSFCGALRFRATRELIMHRNLRMSPLAFSVVASVLASASRLDAGTIAISNFNVDDEAWRLTGDSTQQSTLQCPGLAQAN